jgi:hypothetical protein
LERERLLEEVKKAKPGVEALTLLKKLRLEFDSAIDDYRNSLIILGDTTYEDRKHFLLELIQNADDANYKEDDTVISFVIHNDSLEIVYNETGFTTNDVIAITGTGASTKTANKLSANSFIGEKGIGFKSVFALAKEVQIESGPWRFKLNKENYIVPELISSSSQTIIEGTKLRVYFSNSESVTIVADELLKLVTKQLESFLFLQKLKTFNYRDERNIYSDPHRLSILPDLESDSIQLQTTPGDVNRKYTLYEEAIEFPGHLVGARWERLGSQHSLKRKMSVAAISSPASIQDTEGRLFCYLPTEVKLPIPVFLQLDGHLKADRERLHDIENNTWNKFLLERVPTFLLHAILKWREDEEIALKLPDFIPDSSGWDQLKNVFEALMDKCQYASWVKTFDGWRNPSQVVIADSLWYEWFEEYPDFRVKVENVLGKKFMDANWVKNNSWKSKWKKYGISSLTPLQIAEILRFTNLPEGLLESDESLVSLYEQLLKQHGNVRLHERKVFVFELTSAKIFPLEGGKFGSLKLPNENAGKMYWMSGRTRRSSGLEGIIDVKIINPEYTYTPNIPSDISEDRKLELKAIHLRNELVRQVLRFMDVPEFSDDRLLSELQIPFLLEKKENWTTNIMNTRYRVFQSIFEVYQAKRSFDEGYLNQIGKLSEAYVLGTNGKVKKLYQTILPEKVRLNEEDQLYGNAGMDSLHLPDEWLNPEIQGENQEEKLEVYYKQLRNFLIHIGVANGPKFFFKERKYSNGYEFRQTEEELFRAWLRKINNDYTGGNAVSLKSVTLDAATLQLLQKENVSKEIAKGLYDEWSNKFSRNFDKIDSLFYRFDPPPGYIQTSYKRFENRSPIIPDNHWAGIDRNKVPLITIDGRLTNRASAFKVKQGRALDKALTHFDLVLENDLNNYRTNGYQTHYLSSLDLRPLKIEDANQKWREAEKDSYEELMKAMYELSNLDLDLSELIIFDKVTESFRSIRSFKLGKPVSPTTPYIEEQYGQYGKLLGEKLGLLVDSEVTPLLHILETFYTSRQTTQWSHTNFTRLLQQWNTLRVDDRGKLIHHITELRQANNVDTEILVIFNDEELYQKFYQTNKYVIHIVCDSKVSVQLKLAAKGIGFLLIDDIGTISTSDTISLEEMDRELLGKMLEQYQEDLEEEEYARLYAILAEIGGKADFHSHIMKANELSKVIYGVSIPVSFPYYDKVKNQFFVSMKDTLFEISARLLSSFGFTTYRSANRDFKEIYEKLVRVKAVVGVNQVEKPKNPSSSYTDVTTEFEVTGIKDSSTANNFKATQSTTSNIASEDTGSISDVQMQGAIIKPGVVGQIEETSEGQNGKTSDATKAEGDNHKSFDGAKTENQIYEISGGSKSEVQKQEKNENTITVVQKRDSSAASKIAGENQKISISKTDSTKIQAEQNHRYTLEEVLQQLTEHMIQSSNVEDTEEVDDWKIAIDSEEGQHIRTSIGENLKSALQEGPEYKEVKERKKKEKVKILDKTAQDPKEFLQHEYHGRCQICSTQLKLANDKSYFEVLRIREGKGEAWWANRPFNTLSLCPNCHALAKHGGAIDFSSILAEADLVKQQLTFTQEVEAYHGDYYVIDIVHNGQSKQMVISSIHMEYFTALLEHVMEEKVVVR